MWLRIIIMDLSIQQYIIHNKWSKLISFGSFESPMYSVQKLGSFEGPRRYFEDFGDLFNFSFLHISDRR